MAPAGNLEVGMEISRDQKGTGEDAYESVNFTNNSSTYYVCWPYHASTYANPLTAIAGEPGLPLSSIDSADSLSLNGQRWVTQTSRMPQVYAYAIDNLYVKNGILAPLISIAMIQHSPIIHALKGGEVMEES
jgi:hypothetical protein